MSILSLAEVKDHLNIPQDNANSDAEIAATLNAALAVVETFVGPLEPRQAIVRVSAIYGRPTVLPVFPILSLDSATALGISVSLSAVELDPDGFAYFLPTGDLKLTCTVGRTTVPADIMQAVKEMVRHLWATQRGPTRRPGSTEDSLPGAAYSLPIRVTQLLAPHHVPRVA